jgi:CMP-2-keto-3-deoxyoctulosonic acid synthetase
MERGFAIGVEIVDRASVGIDTPEDYEAFVNRVASGDGCVSVGCSNG